MNGVSNDENDPSSAQSGLVPSKSWSTLLVQHLTNPDLVAYDKLNIINIGSPFRASFNTLDQNCFVEAQSLNKVNISIFAPAIICKFK